jgi:mono/diheme cytochrome c family protein
MPTFQGQLSDEQLNALVEYVKSLAAPQSGRPVNANGVAAATPQP